MEKTEKRKQPRAAAEIRVEYRTVGSFLSDYAVNISNGGIFIHTERPLKVGSFVRLVFSLPGMPFPFDLSGKVKWIQLESSEQSPLPGMGVEFVQVEERVRKRIEAYVKNHNDEMPPSRPETAEDCRRVSFSKVSDSGSDFAFEIDTAPSHPKPESEDGGRLQPPFPKKRRPG